MIHLQSRQSQIEICGDLHFKSPNLSKNTSASCQSETNTTEVSEGGGNPPTNAT